ncbi:helicase-related protein [Dehalogenimonas sp. THU2]|uniref:helicase-related protein n=1 Tax=Dehalogenimonas sp. THU2 TaxID=3151121 RepID=UPI0032183F18
MPRIFDNIELVLLRALRDSLEVSERADFCVGYFNLRGWKHIDQYIEPWCGGEEACCRLLIGMQPLPREQLRSLMGLSQRGTPDQQEILRLKKQVAQEFHDQLLIGAPTNDDEAGLRRLSAQLKANKVFVKLYLKQSLHAKLYLLHRTDPNNPCAGFVGSSNLTFAGLATQGELNVDVLDQDACEKLGKWFNERWNDRWCLDISAELAEIIDTSWAREKQPPPYHIYLKMAYHLSREARAGLSEYKIPADFGDRLFEFQTAAVKIAAHHLNKRGGVLIGDVVGLGKTLVATALARIFQDDQSLETLIICPKNLVKMWQDYVDRYRIIGKVVSLSRVIQILPTLRRHRVVIIDESHNLRNQEGRRYRAISEYVQENESKCILLTATPYNKTYLDLSAQLRLFLAEDKDIGIRPERAIKEIGDTEFIRQHQCALRSLAAFEHSVWADDWRDIMRLYMVRRTRSFVQDNYAEPDETGRKYLLFEDGSKSYFPMRVPKTAKFKIRDDDPHDQYARLYQSKIVDIINVLNLPRYGLGEYVVPKPVPPPTSAENKILLDLSRGGKRLMGFCRVNLFKRLESGGPAFLQSIHRHILRNYVVLFAIRNGLDIPLGAQAAELLDTRTSDADPDESTAVMFDNDENEVYTSNLDINHIPTEADFLNQAAKTYQYYAGQGKNRFKWLRSTIFKKDLAIHLEADARALIAVLKLCGIWDVSKDSKLEALIKLVNEQHPDNKVLIFSQFADTVNYLSEQMAKLGVKGIQGVTGDSADPTMDAWRFSPESNEKTAVFPPDQQIRVLVATDVLSEGQNLQDAHIVVNFDLPWAIIRLVQRAGRVDRIGQKAERILCYSFLPADGIERIIKLRARVKQRLQENAEVVGTDESFFEDDDGKQPIMDLYNERAGIFDGETDTEVDLSSYAYQIWKNAVDTDPSLLKTISDLSDVVYSTRGHESKAGLPQGVLVYVRTAEGNDSLAWVDKEGKSVTQSQLRILDAACCEPKTPAIPRRGYHHHLVEEAVKQVCADEKLVGGQLGRPSGARFRTYERLKRYAAQVQGTLFDRDELHKVIDDVYRYPLRQAAIDTLNRQLKSGIGDDTLAELVIALRAEDRLSIVIEEEVEAEPRIICSMGLFSEKG